MKTPREILEDQKAELTALLQVLTTDYDALFEKVLADGEQIAIVRDQIEDIDKALRSMVKAQTKSQPIMQAILEVLKDKPQGLTARQLLTELNERYYGGRLARHSLSPQLSRLKDRDKKIEYRDGQWVRLPDQPSLFKRQF
jgi:DNA-binding transcriptional ArsR family regulator